ncbi:hypothetical protein JD969_11125 [Planctomycetota bacterium]|nr:hypothetical protein JD969_11125 [Planctomycetota bacterium]
MCESIWVVGGVGVGEAGAWWGEGIWVMWWKWSCLFIDWFAWLLLRNGVVAIQVVFVWYGSFEMLEAGFNRSMRILLDIMIGAMLIATVCFVVMYRHGNSAREQRCEQVNDALVELREQMLYHTSLGEAVVTESGFPDYVDAGWFTRGLPFNQMAGNGRPWIDIAPKGDWSDQPPDPVIVSDAQAGIWYNPNLGVFRARVKQQVSAVETLKLYNKVNRLELRGLRRDKKERRMPIAMRAPSGEATYASVKVGEMKVIMPQVKREVVVEEKIEVVEPEQKKRLQLSDVLSN